LARPKLEAIHVEICALVLFVVVVVATHVVVALVPFPEVVRPIIAEVRGMVIPFKAQAETVPVRAFILWVPTQAACEVAAVFVAPATAGGANLMAALALTHAYRLVTEATVLSDVDPCEPQTIGKLLHEIFPVAFVQVVHRVIRYSQRLPITGGATFRLTVERERVPLFRKSLRKVSEKFRKRGSHSKVLLSQDEPHEVVHHHHGFKSQGVVRRIQQVLDCTEPPCPEKPAERVVAETSRVLQDARIPVRECNPGLVVGGHDPALPNLARVPKEQTTI
jgi:hypothetical protein